MDSAPDPNINSHNVPLNHIEGSISNENPLNQGNSALEPEIRAIDQIPEQQGYIPPDQYNTNIVNGAESLIIPDPTLYLKEKIKSIEKRLHRGWYLCYQIWLYLIIAFTLCALTRQSIYYTLDIIKFGLYSWNLLPLVCVVAGCVWNLRQCWLITRAISNFSLSKADKAFELMKGFMVFYSMCLIFVFIFEIPSLAIILHIYNYYSSLVAFLGANLIIIGVTFRGLTEVRRKLTKRNNLKLELEEFENNEA